MTPSLPALPILDAIEDDADQSVAQAFASVAADYFIDTRDRAMPVSSAHSPAELARRFDESMPEFGQPVGAIIERIRTDIIPDSNHLFHPRYAGHQIAGPLPAAVWTESVTAALNQSVAVFEMSPVMTVLEHRVIAWMNALVGFGPESGGTMTSGGTEATFTGLLTARGAAMPDAWVNGVGGDPPVMLCGEHAHYAVTRAAGELGLGMRNVRPIRSRDYKMDTEALEFTLTELARDGTRIMAVIATAGSTATGSFDDIATVASLCEHFGVWLHVDAAHGGAALLSPTHRHRLRGSDRARSLAWDPHKMMLLPSQAGMLLVRSERDLDAAFAQRAPYLFHGDGSERAWDQGVRNFMCTRRADVLKLWVAIQRYGRQGFAQLYDYFCALARLVYEAIQERVDFEALHEPESNILCFRYIGDGGSSDESLDQLNRELREHYNRSGQGWITGTNLDGRRVLRVTMMNPRTTAADVTEILNGLARTAEQLRTGAIPTR